MKMDSVSGMLSDFAAGVVDYTDNGTCSGCGNCCTNILPVSEAEIRAIRNYIRKHNIKEEKFLPPVSGPVINMLCPFRSEKERGCNIYPVRPAICREFQCDRAKGMTGPNPGLFDQKRRIVLMREEFYGHGG